MCKIDERYYNGFEGEPEMVFTLLKKNGESVFAKMADSYLTDEDAPKGRLLNHFFFVVRGE